MGTCSKMAMQLKEMRLGQSGKGQSANMCASAKFTSPMECSTSEMAGQADKVRDMRVVQQVPWQLDQTSGLQKLKNDTLLVGHTLKPGGSSSACIFTLSKNHCVQWVRHHHRLANVLGCGPVFDCDREHANIPKPMQRG